MAFLAVADEKSFAKAGVKLGVGRSAVSRSVQKLETQLDARLFFRTTRATALTREGELFYESCRPGVERIVQAMAELRELREGPPRGRLRVSATVGFGRKVVAPLLQGFRARHPEVGVDLDLTDGPVDLTAERIDVAFRDRRVEESQVVAKQLLPCQRLVCASAAYAREHGLPRTLEELEAHPAVTFRLASGHAAEWELRVKGRPQKHTPKGMLGFNDAELVLQAVLDGHGLAQLPGYQAAPLVESGQLVPCLGRYAPDDGAHYLCYPSRAQLPARVRVFVDHMTVKIRALNVQCLTTFASA
ncbi:Transcriptional regulator, LysR family protein [Minicystis rosea]|nr:Transcriptional regulator, LysR family protein [Minicystis rosea]